MGLGIEGFDLYSATVTPATRWNDDGASMQAGRFAGQCARLTLNRGLSTGIATTASFACGFALRLGGYEVAGGAVHFALRNGSTIITQFGVNSNGAILIGRTNFTTELQSQSADNLILLNVWNYIEISITRHASTAAIVVKVNGTTVINDTNKNTGAADWNSIKFQSQGGQNIDFDDIWWRDDTTTLLGERRVETLYPTSDTAEADFTPSTGTDHFAVVDEATANGDTDYLSSATVGHKDRFGFGNLSSTPGTIDAIQTVFFARKDDATTRELRSCLKSGATEVNGATKAMTSNYQWFGDVFTTDPDTAGAWAASAVNAIEAGVEVVT